MQSETAISGDSLESRILLLPPTSRDSDVIRKVLTNEGISCHVCNDLADLCGEMARGAGAILVSEESLLAAPDILVGCLASQQVWSDLSVIVLSRAGAEQPTLANLLPRLGNVSVVERPVRITTLLSLIRSALRARQRQYEVRAHLVQQKMAEEQRLRLLESERAARTAAENAGRIKDEFLATLSHELRTPLNGILGWSQILSRGPQSAEDLAEGLQSIERNARAQTQIIEDLLDMSRIVSGKVRLDIQRLNLATVIQAAVDTIKPTADAKGVRIQVVLDPLPDPISGDPNRLQQVFWNLLTNAVKFTPRDQRVQVTLERVDSQLEVSVIDTGAGISPEFLPHVFDRFRQADASTTRRHGGLGLGLAIVKQMVELHGGSVRAMSPGVGKGSTFTVALPVAVFRSDIPAPAPPDHPGLMVAANTSRTHDNIAGLKVLVVDDEPDSRALVKRLLEDCQALVTVAGSTQEAMKLLASSSPDVLVSDIGMPGEDGYSLIQKVRDLASNQGGRIPAVALTAYARPVNRVSALRAGFQHHVTKPVEPAELIAVIASISRKTQ